MLPLFLCADSISFMPVVKPIEGKRVSSTIYKPPQSLSVKNFYEKQHKVMIFRGCGGLGDILMHRMVFEDFKRLMPSAEIHFACPKYYHDALTDHPYIDKLWDVNDVDRDEFGIFLNTTTACGRYEMKLAPLAGDHRSDIWAAHCGVILTKHDMHITMSEEEKSKGRQLIEEHRDRPGPSVAVCPESAMQNKNLQEAQLVGIVEGIRDRGLFPFALHHGALWECVKNDIPVVSTNKIRRWMAVLDQSDYVLTVDTSSFHCAGGMNKPVIGIFSFINGETYGRHYPKARIVQGPCPYGHSGCYNWGACPETVKPLKPCITEITPEMVLDCLDKSLNNWKN